MTTTHTPGPWTVESNDGVDFTVLGGKSSQVRIAVECGERDARLIAAAPDLLAAAIDALETFERRFPDSPTAHDLRAAIARATGADA